MLARAEPRTRRHATGGAMTRSALGPPAQRLLHGAGASDAYRVPSTATTGPGGAPSGSTCYELDNELVSTSAVTSAVVTFSVSVSLPATSATGYQGGTAQVILTAHAVQAQNDALS